MKLLVRNAEASDIAELCELEKECFSIPWSEQAFTDFFSNGCSVCLVAEYEGAVCGYVGMNLILGEGEITNLCVSERYRRLGIGKALMDGLCTIKGLERILLDVRVSNATARALYKKCGFEEDGIRRGFYSKPKEDAVLMSRLLNDK